MLNNTRPEDTLHANTSPDDYSLFKVGATVQLTRPCMIPAIPVGAIGKVIPHVITDALSGLLASRGLYFTVSFDLTSYHITYEGQKVSQIAVFVGTDQMRIYDPSTFIDYVVTCVGNAEQEHVYIYYRPDDYSDPEWLYIVDFQEGSTTHHYFKELSPEVYLKRFYRDVVVGYAVPIPALPKQALSPFHS